MVRLPAGHGGQNASSPELLVDGEEKKSGSTVVFLRRGGATVASGGPAMVRRGEGELDASRMKNGERGAQATLTVVVLAKAEAAGQRRSASDRATARSGRAR
jgi:hypothetical protein